jgi:hypothetical protein
MPMVGRDFTIVAWPYHMRCIAASAVEIRCSRRAGVDLIGWVLISVGSFRA